LISHGNLSPSLVGISIFENLFLSLVGIYIFENLEFDFSNLINLLEVVVSFWRLMMDYSNVIRFLVRGGKGLDSLEVLNRMKVDGINPDIFGYTMVLNGIILEGDYGKADDLFDELLVLGLVPDVYTYNVYVYMVCVNRIMWKLELR
jgi:pentatricopeptide repeat protein